MTDIADHSRQIAGIYALRIAHNVGVGVAAEYYKGVLSAFAVALMALLGPEKTHEVFCEAIGRFTLYRISQTRALAGVQHDEPNIDC